MLKAGTLATGRALRHAGWRVASALAFGGSIAGLVILLGTRDLESYEHAIFSLNRGTAVKAVHIIGQPVYTLALGLGVRLPLHGSLGASPAAALAPYLPVPLTYWLLLAFTIAAAVLVIRHGLEPACGPVISWAAALLLFCSAPIVNYTIYDDWPETAVTYCAFVACVFAPHAMLSLLTSASTAARRRIAAGSMAATVWALLALAHPGYWPLLAVTLIVSGGLVLSIPDRPLRTRLAAVATLAIVALAAVGLPSADILRDLDATMTDAGVRRAVEATRGGLGANAFPFGPLGARFPFTYLVLALGALLVGVASPHAPGRRVILVAGVASIALAFAAAMLPGSASPYAPSVIWALRDPAGAFAVLSGAYAFSATCRSWPPRRLAASTWAAAALALAALQGPAYAAVLVATAMPQSGKSWTQDLTPPRVRMANRGLQPDRAVPGERLALWPGVRDEMRRDVGGAADLADAGYLLVTAWTKQRTMRGLVRPNEILFNQTTDLSAEVLCDARAVRFLRLRYLLRPADVPACGPWGPVPNLRVDDRLAVDVARDRDDRVWAVFAERLTEPLGRTPALSAGSELLPALMPLTGTVLRIEASDAGLRLDGLPVDRGRALVLPVAYDRAWRTSSGNTRDVGGLLALIGVDDRQVRLEFVPDVVAGLRALSMTLAQVLAVVGLLGLASLRPAAANDALLRPLQALAARLAASRFTAVVRQPRNWAYLAFTLMLVPRAVWPPEDAAPGAPLTALLLPITALAVARLARRGPEQRAGGAVLLVAALLYVAAGGSRAATALHDPLFWAVLAASALGVATVMGRWPIAARLAAAGGGACAAAALLRPASPDVDSTFPATLTAIRESFRVFSGDIGVLATLALVGLWLQAIGGGRVTRTGRIDAAIRGALLTGLLLAFSGGSPPAIGPAAVVALGIALGLAEATARHR